MWKEIIQEGLHWVWNSKVELGILITVVCTRKSLWQYFVHDPITGGNGRTQPDELAKWLLMASFIGMLFTYPTVKWPMELFAFVLLSVVAIAKLDKLVELGVNFFTKKKGGTEIDDNIINK